MIQDLYKQKRSLELKWEQEYLGNNRYTLEMVRIDDKVKEVITKIKLEEAPGERPEGSKVYYSYVRDLDGNKICVFTNI